MYTKQEIILKSHREGKSSRQISRELQVSRKTIKKYVQQFTGHIEQVCANKEGIPVLGEHLTTAPEYKIGTRSKRRMTDVISGTIDTHLQANRDKIACDQRKQILKKIDIYEALQSQGFAVGYTTVCNYIRLQAGKHRHKEWESEYLPTPKTAKTLPLVLSQDEVFEVFSVVSNFKHRVILMFIYSTRARVSECIPGDRT